MIFLQKKMDDGANDFVNLCECTVTYIMEDSW